MTDHKPEASSYDVTSFASSPSVIRTSSSPIATHTPYASTLHDVNSAASQKDSSEDVRSLDRRRRHDLRRSVERACRTPSSGRSAASSVASVAAEVSAGSRGGSGEEGRRLPSHLSSLYRMSHDIIGGGGDGGVGSGGNTGRGLDARRHQRPRGSATRLVASPPTRRRHSTAILFSRYHDIIVDDDLVPRPCRTPCPSRSVPAAPATAPVTGSSKPPELLRPETEGIQDGGVGGVRRRLSKSVPLVSVAIDEPVSAEEMKLLLLGANGEGVEMVNGTGEEEGEKAEDGEGMGEETSASQGSSNDIQWERERGRGVEKGADKEWEKGREGERTRRREKVGLRIGRNRSEHPTSLAELLAQEHLLPTQAVDFEDAIIRDEDYTQPPPNDHYDPLFSLSSPQRRHSSLASSGGTDKALGVRANDLLRSPPGAHYHSAPFRWFSRKGPGGAGSKGVHGRLTALFQVSDNRLALKLFGNNRNAVLREKRRQEAGGTFVIHPCSDFRFYWDFCMLTLLIANLIILPVGISFFNDDKSIQWIVFNSISDTIFLLDLGINFRTGIIADNFADEIILDPSEITKRYLKSWFLLDLISSLPLDYLITMSQDQSDTENARVSHLMHAGRALKMFRLVKLLSLLRLLRLSRLVRYVSQWQEFIPTAVSKFMRFFNLIAMILLLGHWNGCLQFLVPMLQDFPADSWVSLEDLTDAEWYEQYTWALFKALSHMLSIGFGRYAPQSITDVWLTMMSMLTGATCYALFVGHTTTLIQGFDASRRMYNEKLKQVEEYMISRKLPRSLRRRMTDYYEHRYHGKMFDEENILCELNECLREEVVNFNCRALVASVPFFTHADPRFVSEIVTRLEFEVFLPGDLIIREGSIGTKMYFIKEGCVDIIARDGRVTTTLEDGSYFGEICLLMKARRVASVRAETFCNLFSLSVDHLHAVLERHPAVRRTMESVADERLRELKQRTSYYSVESC